MLRTTWNVFGDENFSIRYFSSIFLNIVQSPFLDLRELWTLLFDFDIEERMLSAEVKWVVRVIGVILQR